MFYWYEHVVIGLGFYALMYLYKFGWEGNKDGL